jgi:hypothetical protein
MLCQNGTAWRPKTCELLSRIRGPSSPPRPFVGTPCARKTPPRLRLQERDLTLLRSLFECRVMTAAHVAALFFDGKHEYTKKRLQKIKAAGFITARKRRMNEPAILLLTRIPSVPTRNFGGRLIRLTLRPSRCLRALSNRLNQCQRHTARDSATPFIRI